MEKKCPHHPKSVLCRQQRRKDTVGESSGRVSRLPHHTGKVGQMKIVVIPTTGGQLEVCVSPAETVRGLKQVLARKYRIAPARINLLHKDRVLKDGSLRDNQITEGSRVVLCPNMESGTSPSRAEHSVIQALKNLSQSQIHDFLSGRAPLTLAIRLGEHLMFVQLQLSTSPTRSLSVQPTPPSTPTSLSPPPPPSPTSPTPPTAAAAAAAAASASAASAAGASQGGGGTSGGSGGRQVSGNVRPMLVPSVDPVTLLQASHNLTEKLKELTHLTEQALQAGAQRTQAVPSMPLTPPPSPPPSPGAVIDSMHHMGRGVYSGTFSGTLDPRLQDRSGQPRRDVNTILHILHDLLLARPSSQLTPTPSSSSSPTHPHHQAPPSSPRSPTPCMGGEEVVALRDKVQRVQMMLEQRRQRRQTRRLNQRPYPSSTATATSRHYHPSLSQTTSFPFPPTTAVTDPLTSSSPNNTTTTTTTNTAAAAAANGGGSSHGESVDTANYRKPNMEQETVAV